MTENQERILLGPLVGSPEHVQRRRRALAVSTAAQLVLVAIVAWWPQPQTIPFRPQETTVVRLDWPEITFPAPQPARRPPRVVTPVLREPTARPVMQPQPRLMRSVPRRLAATVEPPLARPRRLAEPGPMRLAAPAAVASPVALPKFSMPDAGPDPVQMGGFAAATTVAAAKPAPGAVQPTGFNGPQTQVVAPVAAGTVHAAGFAATSSAASGTVGGGVHTGGFDTVAISSLGHAATSSGSIAGAGFEPRQTRPIPIAAVPAPPAYIPVEILYKPVPVYSAEGRQLGIQGDVVLAVRFQINGQLRVARIVHGLGHGLDEAAERAARQIRFRPAQRGGAPVETAALIRVTFELAQ